MPMFHDDLDDEVPISFGTGRRGFENAPRHRPHGITIDSPSDRRARQEAEIGDINTKLAVISERLKAESTRANAAEHRALDYLHLLHAATEEVKLYKLRLKEAKNHINKAQDTIDQAVAQCNEAEAEAARARALVRKLREEKLVVLAREEGRRLGYKEGLFRGRGMSFSQDDDDDDDSYFDGAGGEGHPSRSSARNTAEQRGADLFSPPRAADRPQMATAPTYSESPHRTPVIITPPPLHIPSPFVYAHWPLRSSPTSTSTVPSLSELAPSFSTSSQLSDPDALDQPLSQGDPSQDQNLQSQSQHPPQYVPHRRPPSSLTHDQPGSPWPANFMAVLSSPISVPENRLMAISNAAIFLDENAELVQDGYGHGLSPPSFHANEAAPHPSRTGHSPSPVLYAHGQSESEDDEKNNNNEWDRHNRGLDHSQDRQWVRDEIGRGLTTKPMEIGEEVLEQIANGSVNGTGLADSERDELLARLESLPPLARPISLFDSDEDAVD